MSRQIRLRRVRLSDVNQFERWWTEPEGNYYDIGHRDATPPPGYADRIRRAILTGATQTWFTVELLDDGPVGYVLYRNVDPRDQSAEIGIRLGQDHWGQGYGTEATFLLLHHLFVEQGLRRIWLHVADFNERAQAMYRKLGFAETGRSAEEDLTWVEMEITREGFRRTLDQYRPVYLPRREEPVPPEKLQPRSESPPQEQGK